MRSVLVTLGVLCLAGGALALATGVWPGAFGPMILGALLLLGTLGERLIYKPLESASPGPGWVGTDERFVDDTTGQRVRVWIEPKSGERRYVRD